MSGRHLRIYVYDFDGDELSYCRGKLSSAVTHGFVLDATRRTAIYYLSESHEPRREAARKHLLAALRARKPEIFAFAIVACPSRAAIDKVKKRCATPGMRLHVNGMSMYLGSFAALGDKNTIIVGDASAYTLTQMREKIAGCVAFVTKTRVDGRARDATVAALRSAPRRIDHRASRRLQGP